MTLSLEYVDGSSDTDVAVLPFADGTHDWEFVYDLFFPSARVTAAVVSVHMRNGVQGEAWFAGVGLIVVPSAACSYVAWLYPWSRGRAPSHVLTYLHRIRHYPRTLQV